MTQLVKHQDKLYQRLSAGSWQGIVPIEAKAEEPRHVWSGPKKSLEQWKQVLAFFEWTNRTYHSEALVYWLVDEEQGRWEVLAPPQRAQGMTVKAAEDHANWRASFERLGPGNRELMGSDHHHCSASAFQSGTDSSDEKTKEGLHMTVGGLGGERYSLHARASFRGLMTDVNLGEWFELPEQFRSLPAEIHAQVLQCVLTQPQTSWEPGTDFPQWWADNYLRESRVITTSDSYRPPIKGHYSHSAGYGGGWNWSTEGIVRDLKRFMAKTVMRDKDVEQPMQPSDLVAYLTKLQDRYGVEDIFRIAEEHRADLEEIIDAALLIEAEEESPGLGLDSDDGRIIDGFSQWS